jgi:acetyltransferase-like isoleucine patch superfamily enzyme
MTGSRAREVRTDREATVVGAQTGRGTGWVDRVASQVKGESFEVDPRVPRSAILRVMAERGAMRARGVIRITRVRGGVSVGSRVRLRSRHQILFGSNVALGPGVVIDALSVHGVVLGDGTSVGRGTRIECTGSLRTLGEGLTVGARVGLGTDCFYGCAGGITIGDDTIIGNLVTFHAENHVAERLDVPIRDQGVTHAGISVGSGCWIGAKATVLDGARIGDGCIVAAGAVVTAGDYPSYGIYGGVPARLLRMRSEGPAS